MLSLRRLLKPTSLFVHAKQLNLKALNVGKMATSADFEKKAQSMVCKRLLHIRISK